MSEQAQTFTLQVSSVRLNVEFVEPLTPVPEPATLALLGVGIATLAARRRSKSRMDE